MTADCMIFEMKLETSDDSTFAKTSASITRPVLRGSTVLPSIVMTIERLHDVEWKPR